MDFYTLLSLGLHYCHSPPWAMADMVPVTLAGRAIAFVLMLGGIAFFSGMTANLASFLIKGKDSEKMK